jgi:hypothetical protein
MKKLIKIKIFAKKEKLHFFSGRRYREKIEFEYYIFNVFLIASEMYFIK